MLLRWRSRLLISIIFLLAASIANSFCIASETNCETDSHIEFAMEQNVEGEGFVNVARFVTGVSGITFCGHKHGSGLYESDENLQYFSQNITESSPENEFIELESPENEFIEFEEGLLYMKYDNTTFTLPHSRSVNYSSRQAEMFWANKGEPASMRVSYSYATEISGNTNMWVSQGYSTIVAGYNFEGTGSLEYIYPNFRSVEDYAGKFKLFEEFTGTSSNKSASITLGTGFVSVDKRVKDSQKSYEHGTGTYTIDEQIDINNGHIYKDINVTYAQAALRLTPKTIVNRSIKWREGILSRDENVSSMGEAFSYIDQLKKETAVKGLNEMTTKANFTGRAEFVAGLQGQNTQFGEYLGSYDIKRKVFIRVIPRYSRPHLSITKEGYIDPQHHDIVKYTITILNDGNLNLGPVYIKDTFPMGTGFVNASIEPIELTSRYANWSIADLPIGGSAKIDLRLKLTKKINKLASRVRAFSLYQDTRTRRVLADSSSVVKIDGLRWNATNVSAIMSATIDPILPTIVIYRLTVRNTAKYKMRVNVTDLLPEGMVFLNSSITPSRIQENELIWDLNELAPGRTKTIEYTVEAMGKGMFVNKAYVNTRSVNGSNPAYADINAIIVLGKPAVAYKSNANTSAGISSEWLPPIWDLDRSDSTLDQNACKCIMLNDSKHFTFDDVENLEQERDTSPTTSLDKNCKESCDLWG
jgi:uncharacterized repeat protein (TIGR01451 family)